MPYKDKPIEKSYFSIGEAADLLGVSASLIRFWETEFDELSPRKNRKGNRTYTKADLELLRTIYHLVKERGYTLKGAKDKLKGNVEELNRDMTIRTHLLKIKEFLLELKQDLDD